MCGLYGNNGKFNVTIGSSGQNGLYRTSGQRGWGINWRNSYERTVGQRDERLRVALRLLLFYERTDMSNGVHCTGVVNGRECEARSGCV